MQDISSKFRFFKLRKKIWRSKPYRLYLKIYDIFLKGVLKLNKKQTTIIFINGMRRSGNHYLMKTLMDSSSASVIFYNNQNYYSSLDIRKGLQTKFRFTYKILLLIGYEDLSINDFYKTCDYFKQGYLKELKTLKLIVVRDLRNIMASRLNHAHLAKLLRKDRKVLEHTRLLWRNHHEDYGDSKSNIIRYSNLVKDLNQLDLSLFFIPNLKESKKVLNRYGGGSSFNNKHFNSRYLEFENDKTFLELIDGLKKHDEFVHGKW
ncbi:hypothetical protein RM697_01785 [Ichthyenterobacterium sp. W332]|uniref:Sulfotransferase domain-containing protein n=1 Tax=Microcosmobacter mediterraneus TaxID=3075607 RepID=A0ABU2YGQ3_9FLAO|nr:hypothetical protein [Ichthyenterobacterium sp. W332]MDT0557359.1 hypothetical protein [Ichthyenterobacterium sp. W332]